jgi:hypothetical protein
MLWSLCSWVILNLHGRHLISWYSVIYAFANIITYCVWANKSLSLSLIDLHPAQDFYWYGDITISKEGLQNLGLCVAFGSLSRDGSLSCHTCCDMGPQFFRSYPKDCPIQSSPTTHNGMWRTYSIPDPHRGYGAEVLLLKRERWQWF